MDIFTTEYDPTLDENYRKVIKYKGMDILLDILDVGGREGKISLKVLVILKTKIFQKNTML